MRLYTKSHRHYCGIDLHTRKMYCCIVDAEGKTLCSRNIKAEPAPFLNLIRRYRDDLIVGVECVFTWYWLSDLCEDEGIEFVLGHALYMKAIHGGKTKTDRIDAHKIAALLRGGVFPLAYRYPAEMRSTRDLTRRRNHLMRKRAALLAHITNLNHQQGLPQHEKRLAYKGNRVGALDRYDDPSVRMSAEVNLEVIAAYERVLNKLELYIEHNAKDHDPKAHALLNTIPGVGKISSLVMLYEIHDIRRFPKVQNFASYARLVAPKKMSAGKVTGGGGRKIGNAHLKWIFSEAAVNMMRRWPEAMEYVRKQEKRHGKGKAISILAHKIGRAVYFMLRRGDAFDKKKFLVN